MKSLSITHNDVCTVPYIDEYIVYVLPNLETFNEIVITSDKLPQEIPGTVVLIGLINIFKSSRLLGITKWMDKFRKLTVLVFLCLITALPATCQEKIGGVTLVAPPRPFNTDPMIELKSVNANWVALVPYGFSRQGEANVRFGSSRQWWGERVDGIRASIQKAKDNGLKIMLKPQVWIPRSWVGEMDFESEDDWLTWEQSYRQYIMTFVQIAVEFDVDMFCVGTEYRIAVEKREKYWRTLISDIRDVYKGKLTYSSNWDSYNKVPFWDDLDYVGISAYFPLSEMDTPPTLLLSYKWNKYVRKLRRFSDQLKKQILFTEYGYLSVDGAAGKTWELEKVVRSLDINEVAQANGYDALLGAFWNKSFWAGGFLWKWFPEGSGHEGYPERDYTPQNKKASKALSEWYGKR